MTVHDIFIRAIELPPGHVRSEFVSGACRGDEALRRKVDALLAAHDASGHNLGGGDDTETLQRDGLAAELSDSSNHGRFLSGTKLAGRYRIVSLLGRGGMGEVYRADDLRLGQTVALKFLPEALASGSDRLKHFHSEVRLARQISHPNVCRVYDIGEVNGQQFVTGLWSQAGIRIQTAPENPFDSRIEMIGKV